MIPLELLHGLGGQKSLSFSAFLEEEVRFPGDKGERNNEMLIRTCVLLMSQFSMKNYTKVGNLDESQISIVNKKLNPTLRKPGTQIVFTLIRFCLTNIAQYVSVIQELIRRHWPLEDFDSEFLVNTHYLFFSPPFFGAANQHV